MQVYCLNVHTSKQLNKIRLIAYSNNLQLCGIARFIACDSMWFACSEMAKVIVDRQSRSTLLLSVSKP